MIKGINVYDALTSEVIASATSHGTATSSGADIKLSNAKMDASAAGFVTTPRRETRRGEVGSARHSRRWRTDLRQRRRGSAAEALIDPASGVNLGTPDKQVAIVRITNVTPKYSIAEVVSGEAPKRNDILRPQERGANP